MALTRISSAGIQTSPTFSGDVRIGAGATLESTGNAYVTGITTLGRGSSGDVYLYNPANSALSGTENSVYGWKAKTYCAGLQVNSLLYLSRSGTHGLQLSYNNATGGTIYQSVGFLNITAVGGPPITYSAYCHCFRNPGGTKFLTINQDADKAVDLYYNNSQKFATTNEGILVSGGATVTGNLSVGGTVTYEDVTNIDSIGIVTARAGVFLPDNQKLQVGNVAGTADFEIAHDTNNTVLQNRTGGLYVKGLNAAGNAIYLQPKNNESSAIFHPDGKVELFNDNVIKFATSGIGATIYSDSADLHIRSGTASATGQGQITFKNVDGNANPRDVVRIIGATGGSTGGYGELRLQTAFNNTLTTRLTIDKEGKSTFSGDVTLTDTTADSAAGPELKLYRNSASPADADYLGQIKFAGESDTGVERNYAKITGKILDASNGTEDGIIEIAHIKAGSQNISARFRSDSLQLLNGTSLTVAGTTTLSDNLDITGSIDSTVAGADNALTLETTSSGDPKICFNAAGAGGHRIEYLRDSLTLNFTNGSSNRLQISAAGHTLPGINDTYDLGSNTVRWRCTFVDKYVGDADLNVTIGCNAGLGITAASTSATKNIIIGHCAGQRLSTCPNNIFIGSCAGQYAIAPVLTVAIGEAAGRNANSAGGTLTAVGAFAGMCNTDGDGNTLIGFGAGHYAKGSSSSYNFYGGYNAGKVSCYACADNPTGGSCNIYMGMNAGAQRAGGVNNVLLGRFAGFSNSTGSNNIGFGNGSLMCNVGGSSNFAGGYLAMTTNVTGGTNVAIGHAAMRMNVSGSSNVAIGYCALALNTCGGDNIALGQCALRCHDTNGGNNFAAGYSALRESEGSHNQVIGHTAGYCNTTGCYNVAIGHQANKLNTTGCHNISLGYLSAQQNETSSDNISIGQYANYCNKAGANIAIGRKTSFHDDVETNGFNVAIGDCAFMGGTDMGTRKHNVAIGIMAGGVSTAGSGNIFVGCYSGYCNGGGGTNVYLSRKAGYFNKTGHDNVMIGDCAGFCGSDQGCNVFIGKYAGYCNCGDDNIAIGRKAGQKIQTGTCNIFMGPQTGMCASTGSNNIGFGFQVLSLANLTGDNNIVMGHYTGRRIATGAGNIFLGSGAGRYVLGGNKNIGIGLGAQYCLSGGNCNVAIGADAGVKQTASDQNVSIGHKAGNQNVTGSGNVAVGHSAGYGIKGANNISIGATSGPANSCINTCDNVFIGSRTGTAYTSGCNIIAIGINAGASSCCAAVGCNNIHIGQNTGCKVQSGDNNVTIGCRAGRNLTTGRCNIFMGLYAGGTASTGGDNVAIGNRAGAQFGATFNGLIAIGCCAGGGYGGGPHGGIFIGRCAGRYVNDPNSGDNIAIGSQAGKCMTCGSNVIIGSGAMTNATAALGNIGLGGQVLQQNLTGNKNVAIGQFALAGNTSGCCNIGLGPNAGPGVTGATGNHNFFGAYKSGRSITTGFDNTIIGRCAGYEITSGSCNVFMGVCAGAGVTSGINNIMMGLSAGGSGAGIGTENTFIGTCTGLCNTDGSCNVFIGQQAGKLNTTGCYNVAIGDRAGCCLKTCTANVLIGLAAGMKLCGGSSNIFIGNQTGLCATTSGENVVMGTVAGKALSSGVNNVAIGKMSGCKLYAGSHNVLLGNCSGYCLQGLNNVMLGMNAGFHRSGNQYCRNVLIGKSAGDNATTLAVDNYDVLIGYLAGRDYTGSCSIGIGHSVNLPINDGMNQLAIGQHDNNWIVGDCNYNVGIGTTAPTSKLHVVGNNADALFKVGAGLTVKGNGQTVFSGVTTFTGSNSGTGALHLPSNKMAVFGNNYIYGAIFNTGAQLTFQALNSYKFCVWDGGGFADWLNVSGVGGQIKLGGCSMGISGSTNKTHEFRLNPHKITMCSSVPDSTTQTKRFELDSYGIQLTGITTITGNLNTTGIVTATRFDGDGSNLTGIVAGIGVGINTVAKVGIGTTNPIAQLHVNVGSSVTAVNVEGSEGQLFSVTNNLSSGSIFAINDITGLPSVDVNADGTIQLAPRGAGELVGIGTTVPTSKLHVVGNSLVSGVITATSFVGDGSLLTGIGGAGFFAQTDVGIHTISKVGVGTTNPIAQLDVNVGSSVTAFNVAGTDGQLFSVTNNLTSGSIFEVNDVSGMPSIDVNADGTIQLAPHGAGELVGIGTTAPTSKLHVVGDTLTTGISTFGGSLVVESSTNSLERVRVTQNGRIGVGTFSPQRNVDIISATNSQDVRIWSQGLSSNSNLLLRTGNSGGASIKFGDTADEDIGKILYSNSSDSLRFTVNASERFIINSNGDSSFSGIITSTGYVLNGTLAKIRQNTSDGSDNAIIGISGGGDSAVTRGAIALLYGNEMNSGNGRLYLAAGNTNTNSYGDIVLNTGGTDRVHVEYNGNVGIATAAARTKLHVSGPIHTDRFFSNPTSLDTSITFPESGGAVNGGVFGPYTIDSGVTLTIASGSTFKVL